MAAKASVANAWISAAASWPVSAAPTAALEMMVALVGLRPLKMPAMTPALIAALGPAPPPSAVSAAVPAMP